MSLYLIIFGAAVREDGSPSGTLARRVEGALAFSRSIANTAFIPTGGVGRHGPAEALVMRELLLRSGIPNADITIEDQALNTLESIEYCHMILTAKGGVDAVVPCTSRYHIPRCALLLRILGYKVLIPQMPADRPHLAFGKWIFFVFKEFVALPRDAVLLLFRFRPRCRSTKWS